MGRSTHDGRWSQLGLRRDCDSGLAHKGPQAATAGPARGQGTGARATWPRSSHTGKRETAQRAAHNTLWTLPTLTRLGSRSRRTTRERQDGGARSGAARLFTSLIWGHGGPIVVRDMSAFALALVKARCCCCCARLVLAGAVEDENRRRPSDRSVGGVRCSCGCGIGFKFHAMYSAHGTRSSLLKNVVSLRSWCSHFCSSSHALTTRPTPPCQWHKKAML